MGVRTVTVTIGSGVAISEGIPVQIKEHIIAAQTPSVWTAADIGIDGSQDNATWFQILDGVTTTISYRLGTNVPIGAASYNTKNQNEHLFPTGYAFIRLHSLNSVSSADVVQAAARTCVVFISNDEL